MHDTMGPFEMVSVTQSLGMIFFGFLPFDLKLGVTGFVDLTQVGGTPHPSHCAMYVVNCLVSLALFPLNNVQ